MTQTDLAKELGVTKGTVSTWETDIRNPTFETLTAMCDLFNRRVDYILGKTDDETPLIASAEERDPAIIQMEEDLTEYILKYAKLDSFGQAVVESVILGEYNRCRANQTLQSSDWAQVSVRCNKSKADG